jgi:hypothetical protein
MWRRELRSRLAGLASGVDGEKEVVVAIAEKRRRAAALQDAARGLETEVDLNIALAGLRPMIGSK